MIKHISLIITILCILSCGGESRKADIGPVYKNGELLVKFKSSVNDVQKLTAHRMVGAQVIKKVKLEGVERIKLPDGVSVEEAVRLYRENPDVEYAEPNYLVRAAVIPNDTRFTEQWHLINTGQTVNGTVGTVGADIDAPEAWGITEGTSSVIVAVIDSGVDKNHPDLKDNLLAGHDFVDDYSEPDDLNGHGTHVAGIIGAVSNNAQGIAGIAWNIKIMPLRALDQNGEGTIADVVDAIAFAAENNVKIINMSFANSSYVQTLYNSIKAYPDILFIAAAGNEGAQATGDNNDVIPIYPASFDLANIISVTATDQNDNLSSFSNSGLKSVDIAAPGENILSTIPSFITGITYSGLYKVIYLAFGFEGINGSFSRNEVMQRVANFAGISGGDSILIIDDDGGSPYETYYTDSLRALGCSFDYYQIPTNGDGPAADRLKQYSLVIWFTGDEYRNTLTLTDQENLRSYLNAGGTLFITGQEIGFDIGQSDFYQNYLRARYVSDSANGQFLTGSNIFAGLSVDLSLTSGDGAGNQVFVDAVLPLGSATAFSIQYNDAYVLLDGTSMSTAVVSGVAALVASYYGNFNAGQLKSVILQSVDIKQSLKGKILTGGRLNAYRALTSLLPPSECFAIAQAGGKVVLSWADNSTAEEGFTIERKRSGDQFREIASVSSGNTTFTDSGLEAGIFTYRVRGFIDQARSSYSNEASVTVQSGAKVSGGSGGGGGCSLGNSTSHQTAASDVVVLFTPLFIIWIMRKKRIQVRDSKEKIQEFGPSTP
jgi:subtilisin family serine protease